MRVKSVTWLGNATVYNMEVEETHDFAVENGVIVHNCYDAGRYFLMARPAPVREIEMPAPRGYDPFTDYRRRA